MDALFQQLDGAWRQARAGRAQWLHLTAVYGWGKSALLDELLAQIKPGAFNALVLRVDFLSREPLAGGPDHVLRRLVHRLVQVTYEDALHGEAGAKAQEAPWTLPADSLEALESLTRLQWPMAAEAPTEEAAWARELSLLRQIAQRRPVVLIFDNLQCADASAQALMRGLTPLFTQVDCRVLLVSVQGHEPGEPWRPEDLPWLSTQHAQPIALPPVPRSIFEAEVRSLIEPEAVQGAAVGAEAWQQTIDQLIDFMGSNRRALQLALQRVTHAGREGAHLFEDLPLRGLSAWLHSQRAPLGAELARAFELAALIAPHLRADLLAKLWDTSPDLASAQVAQLRDLGLLFEDEAAGWCFFSEAQRAAVAARCGAADRLRVAQLLFERAHAAESCVAPAMDAHARWQQRESQEDQRSRQAMLWDAARLFAQEGHALRAAEAGLASLRYQFEQFEQPSMSDPYSRRGDRTQRLALERAVQQVAGQIERALQRPQGEARGDLLRLDLHRWMASARLRGILGDFRTAWTHAQRAFALAGHLPEGEVEARMLARRLRVELGYQSGHFQRARAGIAPFLEAISRLPRPEAHTQLGWLVERLAVFENNTLFHPFFGQLFTQLQEEGAGRVLLKAILDVLVTRAEELPDFEGPLLEEFSSYALRIGEPGWAAEQLARYAADRLAREVEIYSESLSEDQHAGDLDLSQEESPAEHPLDRAVARYRAAMQQAQGLAGETAALQITHLRLKVSALDLCYEGRDRLLDLLEQWRISLESHTLPDPLVPVQRLLDQGLFSLEQIEALTEEALQLAQSEGLDAVFADTLYKALSSELPRVMKAEVTHVEQALRAYQRVRDPYGVLSLHLRMLGQLERRGVAPDKLVEGIVKIFAISSGQFTVEQRAYVHQRLGTWMAEQPERVAEAAQHLERAVHLYDELGEVESVQVLAEILQKLYRRSGDLGSYRALRERLRSLEEQPPGVDPLDFEFQVDLLLSRARQAAEESEGIELVERALHLLSRQQSGFVRADECYVEISKMSRRRAWASETEEGFREWLRRSLEAVRSSMALNTEYGNYLRVFEEGREFIEDLLSLEEEAEYLKVSAHLRELAFRLGNLRELIWLFEDFQQFIEFFPEEVFRVEHVPTLCGFYEAMITYLAGLTAKDHPAVASFKEDFVKFLEENDQMERARYYQAFEPQLGVVQGGVSAP